MLRPAVASDPSRMLVRTTLAALAALVLLAGSAAESSAAAPAASRFALIQDSEFSGTTLGSKWTVYNGSPACCQSTWARSHAVVRGGRLVLEATKADMTSAGVSLGHLNFLYGRVHVRMRMDPGVGIKMCALLWPQTGWPPEIDFAESSSSDALRAQISSTLHYGASNTQIRTHLAIDFTHWHTFGVTWTPGLIRYTVDGRTWATTRGAMVPSQPMHFGIQDTIGLSNGNGAGPDSTTPGTVGLHVDFVKIWRYR
jgi:beta-glucanase (GH16 family)